ncbi:glycosyltransferase family 4 protein [Candidatus Latescibacterota bacterium]
MKILLVNWMDMANPMAGGAEVHLTEIFRRFVKRGDEVTLVSSGFKGGGKRDDYEGIRIVRTGSRETYNFTVPWVMQRLERAERFDIVVEDINKIPLFTPLYLKKPLLVMIPHLFGSTVYRETNHLVASYVYLMEKPIPRVYRDAHFEVISESTARDLEKRGINPKRISVVYCGIDHDTYSADPSAEKFDQPTILYVGRIKRYKSIDVIIRALPEVLKAVPDARLAIVGSGDNIDDLKHLALTMNVTNRVIFTGFISPEEKVDWMRRSHVIVNSSPKEGWGLTNIEANACGTPAVVSDADGLRDSVKDGETGLIFPYGDHYALAGQLIKILHDNEMRGKLSENAVKWAKTFMWDDAARKTMQIVDEIME